MADKVQFRGDTAARWQSVNPILAEREMGLVTDDPNLYKIGDGVTPWNSLPMRGFNGNVVSDLGTSESAVMNQKSTTNLVVEYNVSDHHVNTVAPQDSDRYNTNIFTLEEAIATVPASLHRGGIKLTFISTDIEIVSYLLQSTEWIDDVNNWIKIENGEETKEIELKLDNSNAELNITDASGRVILKLKGGHIKTKNFDSENLDLEQDVELNLDDSQSELNFTDSNGNVVLQLKGGHIKTKNFDSRNGGGSVQPWNGKKIICFGDSITYGVGSTGGNTYPHIIEELTGATVINNGVSGTTVSDIGSNSFVDRISDIDQTADLIIICGGTNDYWHAQTDIGAVDSSDNTTFCGALNEIISWLQNNVPTMQVLFVFPFHQYYSNNPDTHDFGYGTFVDFRDALLKVCDNRGIPVLDLMKNSGVDVVHSTVDRSTFSSDGVHLNNTGYALMAKKIVQYINYTL